MRINVHKQGIDDQHHRNIPRQEQALQGTDKVARRNDVGHGADHRWHTVYLEDKAGEHNRRQEGGIKRHLRGVKLVAGDGGN